MIILSNGETATTTVLTGYPYQIWIEEDDRGDEFSVCLGLAGGQQIETLFTGSGKQSEWFLKKLTSTIGRIANGAGTAPIIDIDHLGHLARANGAGAI